MDTISNILKNALSRKMTRSILIVEI